MRERTNGNAPRVTINQRSTPQRIKAYKRKRWYRSVCMLKVHTYAYTWNKLQCICKLHQNSLHVRHRILWHLVASSGSSDKSFAITPWYLLRVSMLSKQLETRAFDDRKISLISRGYIMRECYRRWTDGTIDISLPGYENHWENVNVWTQCMSVVCPSL
jgi:hypothetical protein